MRTNNRHCPTCGHELTEDGECRVCEKRRLVARRRTVNPSPATAKNVTLWQFFSYGFLLSLPLAFTYWFGFTSHSMSNQTNNVLLLVMFVIGVLTLPGSLILFVIGFVAAFQGKAGELFAMLCIFLSVANAHLMGMVYAKMFSRKSKPTTSET